MSDLAMPATIDPDAAVVVLHDIGDARGGAAWRKALDRAGWRGPIVAPDLPGHGDTPAPIGGSYESGDALLHVLPLLRELAELPVAIGAGVNGWAAQLLGIGGRAQTVVVVDGLGGPWRTPSENIAAGRSWLRAIAADPPAVSAAPARGLDPRAAHGVPAHGSRRLALKAALAMPVPVVVIETPASPLRDDEVREILDTFSCGVAYHRVTSGDPLACIEAALAGLVAAAPQW